MKILLVAPMEVEYLRICSALKDSAGLKNSYKAIYAGVGKVDSAASVSPELGIAWDLIVVIGFAAGSSFFSVGEIVSPSFTRYHDVDVPEGLCPALTKVYELDGNDDSIILTGDSFINSAKAQELVNKYGEKILFDMESAAVAQVAGDVPVMVLKVISDIPQNDDKTSNFESFVNSYTDFKPFISYLELIEGK